jgi:hypothetical protein
MERFCRALGRGEVRLIVQGLWDGLTPAQFKARAILTDQKIMSYTEATRYLQQLGATAASELLSALRADPEAEVRVSKKL